MQAHQVHEIIHHISRPRHITNIFQQAKGSKEDHHDRQEGQHRTHSANDAIDDQAAAARRVR